MLKLLNGKLLSLSTLALLISTAAFAWGGSSVIIYNPASGVYTSASANSRQDAEADALYAGGAAFAGVSPQALENKETNLIETWGTNCWVAMATGTQTDASGKTMNIVGTAGNHSSQAASEADALTRCASHGATDCTVARSFASFDNQADIEGTQRAQAPLAPAPAPTPAQ